jgi:hypothetical protein
VRSTAKAPARLAAVLEEPPPRRPGWSPGGMYHPDPFIRFNRASRLQPKQLEEAVSFASKPWMNFTPCSTFAVGKSSIEALGQEPGPGAIAGTVLHFPNSQISLEPTTNHPVRPSDN